MIYFQLIPEELNIEILLYANTKDFFNLVKIEPYDELLNNSRIWRILFHRKFTQLNIWNILELKEIHNFKYYFNIYIKSNSALYTVSKNLSKYISFKDIGYLDISLEIFKNLEEFQNFYLEYMNVLTYIDFSEYPKSVLNLKARAYTENGEITIKLIITPVEYDQLLFYFNFMS